MPAARRPKANPSKAKPAARARKPRATGTRKASSKPHAATPAKRTPPQGPPRAPRLGGRRMLVTGGAGFIGSHLVDALVAAGHDVTVVDDLSAGSLANLHDSLDRITWVKADCGDDAVLDRLLPGIDTVWHLAANPDVRAGATAPTAHVDPNIGVTVRLLEAMRRNGVTRMRFTSTSTVYGTAAVLPTPEHYGPLYPISIYGGAKLAGEAMIAAYAGTFGMDALLFRFANVVGPRSGHGVIVDFVRKLRRDPKRLEILGDGRQTKSYVSVRDTVAGMLHADLRAPTARARRGCVAYNIGSLDAVPVTELADVVCGVLGVRPARSFTGGAGGWAGDVPKMRLDTAALEALGWTPQDSSSAAIRAAATWASKHA